MPRHSLQPARMPSPPTPEIGRRVGCHTRPMRSVACRVPPIPRGGHGCCSRRATRRRADRPSTERVWHAETTSFRWTCPPAARLDTQRLQTLDQVREFHSTCARRLEPRSYAFRGRDPGTVRPPPPGEGRQGPVPPNPGQGDRPLTSAGHPPTAPAPDHGRHHRPPRPPARPTARLLTWRRVAYDRRNFGAETGSPSLANFNNEKDNLQAEARRTWLPERNQPQRRRGERREHG